MHKFISMNNASHFCTITHTRAKKAFNTSKTWDLHFLEPIIFISGQ